MPIEIKELHIRVAVNTTNIGQPSLGGQTAASRLGMHSGEEKEAFVAECVEQVLEILRRKTER